jgi:hypothetical protein
MGWVSAVPSSFGECLEECIKQIAEDNGILLRESFRSILSKSARDWCSIAYCLNSGKNRSYNLHQMGSKIKEIEHLCHNPVLKFNKGLDEDIEWDEMLKDVRIISKIVLHEMQNNLVSITPDGIRDLDKTREYADILSIKETNHA